MTRIITIDPITRLEGHGKISIFLDDQGEVERALFQVPELRGFEAFCVGRPAEDMPQITSRICGVCPTAHHMAATKTLDDLYGVEPTPAAKAVRELFYSLFTFEDHALHYFFLGGPDFIVGPDAPAAQRNVLGVIQKVGVEVGKRVIGIRKAARDIMKEMGGKAVHPVLGLPGGVSKGVSEELRKRVVEFGEQAVDFALFSLGTFDQLVLENQAYLDIILSDTYFDETYYMGMVDENDEVNLYDGRLSVVDPGGKRVELFEPSAYTEVVAEHVESWSYIKFPFLKKVGWKGFRAGADSGVVRVAPLARLNAARGMATPLAQEHYQRMYETLGGKPVHHTLALHWARLVELLYAAERIAELGRAEQLTSPELRNMQLQTPREGVGAVEAPRGTLIHHYRTDEKGVITGCNLLVATVFNSAPICISIERAAKKLISGGKVDDGLLNRVEMAFRAYDPCLSCATHSLPGKMPLEIRFCDNKGEERGRLIRDSDGSERMSWEG
jgi:F420-non-reducing hydrogenase large subunit